MKPLTTLIFVILMQVSTLGQTARYSVVINELLPDPSPVIGLPNTEYIELRNNTKQPINLNKWRVSNGSTTASINLNYSLGPDSLVVICSKTQVPLFNGLPNVLGVTSFPALNNDGDIISLIAADGTTIHAVSYSLSDYQNTLKANGGWSLEMIDPYRGCDKNNWIASTYFAGGTPGKENSVFKRGTSSEKIIAQKAIAIDSMHVRLFLDQGVDSLPNTITKNYAFDPFHEPPSSVSVLPPLFNIIELSFKTPIHDNTIYQIKSFSLKHCSTSDIDTVLFQTGIMHDAFKNDIVINELLFDPPSGGSDFIELYNKSNHILNTRHIHLSNRTAANLVGTAFAASEDDENIFPGEYLCLSTDRSFVQKQWPTALKSHILEMKYLPSYPDDEGTVILLNRQGEIIDEMHYQDNMHFPLIRNKEGVSLERVSSILPSNYNNNWHSAASSVGYATPGYKNSQHVEKDSTELGIELSNELITPNNDGVDDNLIIHYVFPSTGYMTSVFLFDSKGFMIKKISDNQLCGSEGSIIWDGLIGQQKASPGLYFIKLEAYHLSGKSINRKWAVGVK